MNNGLNLLLLLIACAVIAAGLWYLDMPGHVVLTVVVCFAFLYFVITEAPQ